jgi:hypothetical protein
MLEIHPVAPSFPVVKPKKINRDDNPPQKRQRGNKQEAEKQDAEPVQHIDEIV